jgi:hypothetical protein
MSQAEMEVLKEYVKLCISGVNARIDDVSNQTEEVRRLLSIQNGRVGKSEQALNDAILILAKLTQKLEDEDKNRGFNCPHLPKMDKHEKEMITKKQLYGALVVFSIIVTILSNLTKIM